VDPRTAALKNEALRPLVAESGLSFSDPLRPVAASRFLRCLRRSQSCRLPVPAVPGREAARDQGEFVAPEGIHAGVTVFSGDGIVIGGGSIEVVLRGLSINGQGGNRGIWYTVGSRLTVERCVVRNMTSHGIWLGFVGNITIEDSVIRDNGGNGINITGNPNVVVARTTIEGNVNGIAYTSTFGPAAKLAVSHSSILRNSASGISAHASGPALSLSVTNSTIARNGATGIGMGSDFGTPVTAAIGSNVVVHNHAGISAVSNGNAGVISGGVSENVVMDNVQFGIQASGVGALLALDRNTVTHNDDGIRAIIGAIVETRANNVVRKNNTNTVGGPFTFVGGI
jgi:hypothetical protein